MLLVTEIKFYSDKWIDPSEDETVTNKQASNNRAPKYMKNCQN